MTPVAGAGGVVSTPAPAGMAAKTGGVAVARTVVDNDSGGTALAIAALISSLVAFGIVLLSYLGK
jgi:hypothetical protein